MFDSMFFFVDVIVFIICMVTYYTITPLLSAILMIMYSIIQYILISKKRKSLIDIKAIFILTWFSTMGLSMLRLLNYQEQWPIKFFVAELIGVCVFLLSVDFGHFAYKLIFYKRSRGVSDSFNIVTYRIVILFTFVGLICYFINLKIVGFIPLFDESVTAYVRNTSKFMTIEVGLAPTAGAAYYCITRKNIGKLRRIIMWACLILNLVVYPILNLSRGNLVANVCMFLPVYFFCSKDKKEAIRNAIIGGLIAFIGLTIARGGDFSLVYKSLGIKQGSLFAKLGDFGNTLAMLYAYLTCSHDNFALNIPLFNSYTYGLRMFNIFNEILDISWIQDVLANSKTLWVTYFLNTHDTFAFFYYDIGIFGIILWTFIWGTIWGASEKFCQMKPSAVSYMMFGISFYCVAFAFFTSKTGFVTAMWYGTTWLCFLFQKVRIRTS